MLTRNIQIDQITIENFQSIKEKVAIPLRPITFLYGPNSAGKSSIFDALCFFESVFKDDEAIHQNYFKRWAHTPTKNDSSEQKPVQKMTIEIKFSSPEFLLGGFHRDLGDISSLPEEFWCEDGINSLLEESNGPYEIKVELYPTNWQIEKDGYVSPRHLAYFDISIKANGLEIIKIQNVSEDDTDDYTEIEFNPKSFGSMFKDLARRHEVNFSHPKIHRPKCWLISSKNGLEIQNDADNDSYDRDLIKIANHFIRSFTAYSFKPHLVSSDRHTIPNSELAEIYSDEFFVRNGFPSKYINAPIGALESFNAVRKSALTEIAKSKFVEHFSKKDLATQKNENLESLLEFINRSLLHHLFLDQGYQLDFDICTISPPDGLTPRRSIDVALLVAYLIDNSGRRVTFEDVGTGISCVLPVLTALHGHQSFIQQPELHLHPALQSALGDILVETVSRKNQGLHIIETHSDYLLLRCLRRIRDTTNGRISKFSNLSIKPSDISILYFEPQSEGTTKIKSIRVSTQGDFIDRWPRGFFEERGKDIFDE